MHARFRDRELTKLAVQPHSKYAKANVKKTEILSVVATHDRFALFPEQEVDERSVNE